MPDAVLIVVLLYHKHNVQVHCHVGIGKQVNAATRLVRSVSFNYCYFQSINKSKQICIAQCVASESEAHLVVTPIELLKLIYSCHSYHKNKSGHVYMGHGISVVYRQPEVDRSSKPFIDHFTSTGEAGLKTVFVPDELVPLFLHCAMANSVQSIETCGILCGKLVCINYCIVLEIVVFLLWAVGTAVTCSFHQKQLLSSLQ